MLCKILFLSLLYAGVQCEYLVYWNVPTHQCVSHGINFDLSQFNIIQNDDDQFRGKHVDINYHPGKFPYIDLDTGEEINGGIPQKADFDAHAKAFTDQVDQMPLDFDGVAILDFENYYPSYGMSKSEYKEASKTWVKEQHPDWTQEEINIEAESSFNASVRILFEELLLVGRALRPKGRWTHYAFPYCHNYDPEHAIDCKQSVMDTNDNTGWLFNASGCLTPSVYLSLDNGYDVEARRDFVVARTVEAARVRESLNLDVPIYPYTWFRYRDTDETYLSLADLENSFRASKENGASGALIWGSSADVNSLSRCQNLKDYIYDVLGPYILQLSQE